MADDVQQNVQQVQELIERKNRIEEEIKELNGVLESDGVGMTGNLVDNEDYPRQDIDVYTVRVARNRIICLQNDHKALMKEIEEGLHIVHAAAREKKKQTCESHTADSEGGSNEGRLPAFLTVDCVSPGSPAEKAGLQLGDEIVKFGSVNADNFQNLQTVASVVQHSKGQSLGIVLRRANDIHRLSLIPTEWSGRGLLGCNIVPLKK